MNADHYRQIMRHQAGAVSVIACRAAGVRSGLTATAVASLSADPPMVLACVNQAAGAHDEIVRANAFSINLLSEAQRSIAELFSGKAGVRGDARFDDHDWQQSPIGNPILQDALASLDCELAEQHRFTTHSIFIGRVVGGSFRADEKPLLYFRGDYWDVSASAGR